MAGEFTRLESTSSASRWTGSPVFDGACAHFNTGSFTAGVALVDGYVAGVWRPAVGGIEATAFHRLSDDTWEELGCKPRSLVAFLADRELKVYRRYYHSWRTLAGAGVRLISGD